MRYASIGLLTVLSCVIATATVSAQKVQRSDRLSNALNQHQGMLKAGFEKQLDSILHSSEEDGSWTVDDKEGCTYGKDGLLKELIDYDLAPNNKTWEVNSKVGFFYNSNALLERIEGYYLDEDTEEWIKEDEQTMIYDSKGNLTEALYLYYDEDLEEWVKDGKTTYTYNANNLVTAEIESYFDTDLSAWEESDKIEYSYDVDGNLEETIDYSYDMDAEVWLPSSKSVYTLSTAMQIQSDLSYNWNSVDSKWEESSLSTYTYDKNGNPTSEAYAYGKQDGEWFYTNKFGYSYDLTVKIENVASLPLYFFLPDQSAEMVNMYTGFLGKSYNNGSWGDDSKTEMFYSDAPSSIAPEVTFEELAEVVVRDGQLLLSARGQTDLHYTLLLANGQVIRSGMLSEFGSIGLQVPSHGIYLLQVRTNKAAGTQKVLVH